MCDELNCFLNLNSLWSINRIWLYEDWWKQVIKLNLYAKMHDLYKYIHQYIISLIMVLIECSHHNLIISRSNMDFTLSIYEYMIFATFYSSFCKYAKNLHSIGEWNLIRNKLWTCYHTPKINKNLKSSNTFLNSHHQTKFYQTLFVPTKTSHIWI